MKLRQNGIVSFSIKLDAFQASVGARVKLHHLLQKCSFFLIKLAVFQASGSARMKLHLFRQDLQDYQDFFGLVYLSCPSC
jgi:hypothetical protein